MLLSLHDDGTQKQGCCKENLSHRERLLNRNNPKRGTTTGLQVQGDGLACLLTYLECLRGSTDLRAGVERRVIIVDGNLVLALGQEVGRDGDGAGLRVGHAADKPVLT